MIIILTRPRPVRLLAAFLIGGMATSVLVGLGVLALINTSGVVSEGSGGSVSPAIDIVVGLVSLTLAYVIASGRELPGASRRARRKQEKEGASGSKDPWTNRILGRDSVGLVLGLGVVLDLPSVWYLAALKDISAAGHGVGAELGLILLFNLIMFALIEIPLACYLIAPERSAAAVARFNDWIHGHMRPIGAGVAALVGAYLVINGIADLI